MEREIKFRAYHLKRKKMYPVSDITFRNNFIGCNALNITENKIGDTIGVNSKNQSELCFELMQYTGLKDCKDKETYEKDICKGTINGYDYDILIVEKRNGCFGLYEPKTKQFQTFYSVIENNYNFEIVGNIYENPELLK